MLMIAGAVSFAMFVWFAIVSTSGGTALIDFVIIIVPTTVTEFPVALLVRQIP